MDTGAVNNAEKQRGRPFRRGVSGNPRGRPIGARNRRTCGAIRVAEAEGELPLEFLLGLMRDRDVDLPTRIDAAKSALPYLHARLTPVATVNLGIKSGELGADTKLIDGSANPAPPSPLMLELQAWHDAGEAFELSSQRLAAIRTGQRPADR
jgi:hypothetical protein